MAELDQTEDWDQQNRNKVNNTKDERDKEFVLQENQQKRENLFQTNQKSEREYPN